MFKHKKCSNLKIFKSKKMFKHKKIQKNKNVQKIKMFEFLKCSKYLRKKKSSCRRVNGPAQHRVHAGGAGIRPASGRSIAFANEASPSSQPFVLILGRTREPASPLHFRVGLPVLVQLTRRSKPVQTP
jgi:hypothetical protein